MRATALEVAWHSRQAVYAVDVCHASGRLVTAGADTEVRVWRVGASGEVPLAAAGGSAAAAEANGAPLAAVVSGPCVTAAVANEAAGASAEAAAVSGQTARRPAGVAAAAGTSAGTPEVAHGSAAASAPRSPPLPRSPPVTWLASLVGHNTTVNVARFHPHGGVIDRHGR